MTQPESSKSHSDMEELLPWYVNGTLTEADQSRVQDHLETCQVCQENTELLRSMQAAVLRREVEPIVPATSIAEIVGERPRKAEGRNPAMTRNYLAVAATVAVVVIGVWLLMEQRRVTVNTEFYTATEAGTVAAIDYLLRIEFDGAVSTADREELIRKLGRVSGYAVADDGVYTVHLQLENPTLTSLEEIEGQVASSPGIRAAEFVALRLPVK